MNRRSFLAAATAAGAALALPRTASAADLRDDIRILREALKLHPGLYRYSTPRQVEARLAALEPGYIGAPDTARRYLALQRFLATVRCGHTHCNPYNQTRVIVEQLYDRPTRLPFSFAWIGREMVVLDGAPPLVRGSVVTRLNGMAPARLLAELLPYARADGGNDAKRVAQLAMRNTDRLEQFDLYQGLAFPPPADGHEIAFRTPDGARRSIVLPALTLAQRRTAIPDLGEAERKAEPLWTWRVENDVAILTMPTWVTYRSRWDWKAWLNERLDTLGPGRGLLIDLRDNEGGTDCGSEILSRLAHRDLTLPGYQPRVRFRRTPTGLDPYLDTYDESIRRIGEQGEPIGDGFFYRPDLPTTDFIAAKGPRVTARVAALVGPTCSSATYIFARRARLSGLVHLFGETTGGNLRGINGGNYFFVRLPGSGIEFDLPVVGYFPTTPQPDSGVVPNVTVARSPRDIALGRDPAMAAALAWARSA